jgi:hypothetical protein
MDIQLGTPNPFLINPTALVSRCERSLAIPTWFMASSMSLTAGPIVVALLDGRYQNTNGSST